MRVQALRERVRAEGLLGCDGPVVAMLSGGRDSVCLLDVAVALRGSRSVHALHVNYGLRADGADDELYCRSLCAQLDVELSVVRAGGAPPGSGNLQAWARELRYREALALARDRGAPVATGHTASDQVETILYRLCASPGRRALLGMSPCEGSVVRPLLWVTRAQTAEYCRERGLRWREDETNDSDRFARARVRNGLLEALRAVHPGAETNLLRTAALLREETELLDGLVSAELAGAGAISLARLRELPAALARMVVVRLAEQAAGGYVPQAGERVQEILALGARGGTAQLHVGGQACAVIADGELTMVRLPPRGH
jgi:tRNA(Ile)-lysidine synthase